MITGDRNQTDVTYCIVLEISGGAGEEVVGLGRLELPT
jgi:hypothetical protein